MKAIALSLLSLILPYSGFAAQREVARAAVTSPSLAPPEPEPAPVEADVELPDLTLDKSGGITLTIEDCIRLAIASASSVLKADHAAQVSGAALLQSYGQFLPNLAAQANYGYQTGSTYYTTSAPTYVNGSNAGAAYALTATLNLFNGLADYSGLKASILREDAANLSLYRAKQSISLDITQGFLQVVLDNQLVKIARKNLQESSAREKLLEEQTNLGARNLSDLFRQQAQTTLDESLLLTSENRSRTDQVSFLRKLRVDVAKSYHFIKPANPKESADPRFEDEGALLRAALAQRVDLKASEDAASAAKHDITSNWSGYLPKIDLSGGMSSGGHTLYSQWVNSQTVMPASQPSLGYQLDTQIEYSVGVYLTWNLFDRFTTHENVAKARAAADDADIDAQDRHNQVEGDVREAYGDYETAIARLRSSKKGLEAAQKAYEVIEGRYEVGSANFIDLITAQATLVQAESTRAQALFDFMLEGKSVEFATGGLAVP